MLEKEKLQKMVWHHRNSLLSVAINTLFFLLIFLICGFQYELSDDWFFSLNIANGNYNFTFCSYFIQLISGLLQKIIYPINAFMLLQLVFGWIALTSISYVFLDTFGMKKGLLFALLLQSAFAINVYSLITFTKTAAVLVTAGGLLIFWAHCKEKKLRYYILGVILALLGSFYRLKIFYSVVVVFSFFVFAYLIHQTKPPMVKGFFKACKKFFQTKMAFTLLILIIAVFSCNSISQKIIYSSDGLAYYKTYNSLRSSVVDFQIPSYDEEPEKFDELGISENDIEMLRNWYIDDQGLASVEKLKEISKIQAGRQTQTDYLINMAESFMGMAELLMLVVYIFTVVGLLILYRKKALLFICLVTAAVGLLYGYLFIIGRCNYRSAFSIWFSTIVCLFYATQFFELRKWISREHRVVRAAVAASCILVSLFYFSFGILRAVPSLVLTPEVLFPETEKYIASSENKTFALGRSPYLLLRNMVELDQPMLIQQNEAFEKCVYFGTPYYAHPSYHQLLKEKGIDNLYTALAEKENLYFVDHEELTDIEKMIIYLNKWYGEKKTYDKVLVHHIEEFDIYKIVAVDKN